MNGETGYPEHSGTPNFAEAGTPPEASSPDTESGTAPSGRTRVASATPTWWKRPWAVAILAVVLVALVAGIVLVGKTNPQLTPSSKRIDVVKKGAGDDSTTTTPTANGSATTGATAPQDGAPTTTNAPSATSPTTAPVATTTGPPATAVPAVTTPMGPLPRPDTSEASAPSTSTTTLPALSASQNCELAVERTGQGVFRVTYQSRLGAGVTITFSGGQSGRAMTDAQGTASFLASFGYSPTATTGPVTVVHETAKGPSCTAAASISLPRPPGG